MQKKLGLHNRNLGYAMNRKRSGFTGSGYAMNRKRSGFTGSGQVTIETTLALIIVFILMFACFRMFIWFTGNLVLRDKAYKETQPGRNADTTGIQRRFFEGSSEHTFTRISARSARPDFYHPGIDGPRGNDGTGELGILGE